MSNQLFFNKEKIILERNIKLLNGKLFLTTYYESALKRLISIVIFNYN